MTKFCVPFFFLEEIDTKLRVPLAKDTTASGMMMNLPSTKKVSG